MGFSPSLPLLFLSILFQTGGGVCGDCYTSIFSFGDSLTDTGNRIYFDPKDRSNSFPYGQTYFHRPTGRSSDGRLIIDFIAQALGLPLIPPYLGHTSRDFGHGVNFAVGGATALDVSFFHKKGVDITGNYSLEIQLEWFKQVVPSLCISASDCRKVLKNALFLVGEIGGNDYGTIQSKGLQEMRAIVPNVIDVISSTITALVDKGAVTLLVPGVEPFGCFSMYLTIYQSENKDDYDPSTGCLKWWNDFAQYHNHLLQNELSRLKKIHPRATIIYVDYYSVAMDIYRFPYELGLFRGALKVCCGGGGPYNFNSSAQCGSKESKVCHDPALYMTWDGVHLTEAAHKLIASGILQGAFAEPRIDTSCLARKSLSLAFSL